MVTVIIPTHNHPKTIKYSISSVQNQTFGDLDIVVIGDGTNKETKEIIREIIKADKRAARRENLQNCTKSLYTYE